LSELASWNYNVRSMNGSLQAKVGDCRCTLSGWLSCFWSFAGRLLERCKCDATPVASIQPHTGYISSPLFAIRAMRHCMRQPRRGGEGRWRVQTSVREPRRQDDMRGHSRRRVANSKLFSTDGLTNSRAIQFWTPAVCASCPRRGATLAGFWRTSAALYVPCLACLFITECASSARRAPC
jgi:hypothetical protein